MKDQKHILLLSIETRSRHLVLCQVWHNATGLFCFYASKLVTPNHYVTKYGRRRLLHGVTHSNTTEALFPRKPRTWRNVIRLVLG